MASNRTAFRLAGSWDQAALALERAIQHGRDQFELLARGNGVWRVRHRYGVTLSVEIRVETAIKTVILVAARHNRLELHVPRRERNARAIRELREAMASQFMAALHATSPDHLIPLDHIAPFRP